MAALADPMKDKATTDLYRMEQNCRRTEKKV